MQPFPPNLWARIQVAAQGLRENHVNGYINVRLNYVQGMVGSWDCQVGEHHNEAVPAFQVLITTSS